MRIAHAVAAATLLVLLSSCGSDGASNEKGPATASYLSQFAAADGHAGQFGTVQFYDASKGYGFIVTPDGTKVFVHFSALAGTGLDALSEGQEVWFDTMDGKRGPQAENLTLASGQN